MRLTQARGLADALVDAMRPAAARIEVAGSIRREQPEVKDIEIVAIPLFADRDGVGQMTLGAPPPTERVNLLREVIEGLRGVTPIKPGTHEIIPWHLTTDGSYWRLWLERNAVKVDVFLVEPSTWGLGYLVRTGSGIGPDGVPAHGFGPAILQRWKSISGGGRSEGLRLTWPDGRREPTPEEADVFRVCRLAWVEPRDRTSDNAVRKACLP